ncbi:amidohydrolase family protein, partial [candidate division KSB1 bacterium]|nr:amidohydrolase family protein [candidate division KSB1 bacterium]
LGESFMRGVEKLAAYSLTFDILIFARHLPAAIEFVGAFPNHKFVVDHIAKPFIKDGILEPWKQHMIKLASFPNVMCKLSGMVTEADWKNWCVKDFEPYLDTVFTAFGPDRVMFGSDWPVCTVAATYRQVMELVGKWLEKKNATPRVKENFWGGNAAKFYRLKV